MLESFAPKEKPDHPQEACAVFGVYAPGEDVARLTCFGLQALQHRGQESAGIAVGCGIVKNRYVGRTFIQPTQEMRRLGITPAAGFVEPWAAVIIGLVTAPCCFFAISVAKRKIGYDDALDAFGCHSVGGIVGGILTGLFCVPELSWTDLGGLFYTGDPSLLVSQVLGILVTLAFVVVGGLAVGLVVKAAYGGSLRVSEADEARGLDVAAHGESAYPAYLGLD